MYNFMVDVWGGKKIDVSDMEDSLEDLNRDPTEGNWRRKNHANEVLKFLKGDKPGELDQAGRDRRGIPGDINWDPSTEVGDRQGNL